MQEVINCDYAKQERLNCVYPRPYDLFRYFDLERIRQDYRFKLTKDAEKMVDRFLKIGQSMR